MAIEHLHLDCPSGLAGNLFATALISCGVPESLIRAIPRRLGLPDAFQVVFDGYAYDGEYTSQPGVPDPIGTPAEMMSIVQYAYPGMIGKGSARILSTRYRYEHHAIRPGEGWCDTMFDATAAAVGLDYLGWPTVVVHGPLPSTKAAHPVSAAILHNWWWVSSPLEVELVTPTAAAILESFGRQTLDPAPNHAIKVEGHFTRKYDLEPLFAAR